MSKFQDEEIMYQEYDDVKDEIKSIEKQFIALENKMAYARGKLHGLQISFDFAATRGVDNK